jgi:hypothetical protein
MKHVQLLNWIIGVVAGLALIIWAIGLYRQHTGKDADGWPLYAFLLCWGFLAIATSGRAILKGEIGSGTHGRFSRQRSPVQFWIGVGLFSVAGIVVMIIAVLKMATHL